MNILERIKLKGYELLGRLGLNTVFYVNSPQALPPPLSAEKERELIELLGENDAYARNKLVEHNLRLVVYIAKKFENTGINIEDLVSIGSIGLIKAVNTFKPDKNIKLATYSSRCIENEILMHLRKVNQQRLEISLDEPLNVDWDGNELHISDVMKTHGTEIDDNLEREDEERILHSCIKELSRREKLIMSMRFGMYGQREYTQKEVADILGISQSYISRLEKRILQKLKRDIEKQTVGS